MGYTCGRKLDESTCHKIAVTCNSIVEFARKDISAYQKSLKQGWLDKWFKRKTRKPLTKEDCRKIAKTCKSKSEFKRKCHAAYIKAMENGWIASYGFEDTRTVKSQAQRKISDIDVEAAAKKYTSRGSFFKNDRNMYIIALRRKLLDKFDWLSKNAEIESRGFKDCIYVYEFEYIKVAYVGRTVEPIRRDNNHRKPGDSVYEFAKSIGVDVPAAKYLYDGITTKEGQKLEHQTIEEYRQKGWALINKAKAGSLGALASGKLNKKHCLAVARKYNYVYDLVHNDKTIYWALRHYGWYKECTWLKLKRTAAGTWSKCSKEICHKEALKYKTRSEFMKGSGGAYKRAAQEDWLKEWFPITLNAEKRVGQFTLDGKTMLNSYKSIAEAATAMGVKHPTISACCRGKHKSCKGFVFKFI